MTHGQEDALLARITLNPEVFGGKPIIRGHRLAVEHVLGMLAAGDSIDDLLREYPWLERDDVQSLPRVCKATRRARTSRASRSESGCVKVLIDTCMAGSVAPALAEAGHDVECVVDWPSDPGDADILAHAQNNRPSCHHA